MSDKKTVNDKPAEAQEELLEFPLALSVKAIGLNDDSGDFKSLVSDTVAAHLQAHQSVEVTTLPSSGGKYLSVRVRFTAESREQLEAIYQALHQTEKVLFAL